MEEEVKSQTQHTQNHPEFAHGIILPEVIFEQGAEPSALYFVSDRHLLGSSIFARVAKRLCMSYAYVDVEVVLEGRTPFLSSSGGSVAVVDLSSIRPNMKERVIESLRPVATVVALIERSTFRAVTELLAIGYSSIIDMTISEDTIPLVISLAKSGQTFFPRASSSGEVAARSGDSSATWNFGEVNSALARMGLKTVSPAEREVLSELLLGGSNKVIASRTGRSVPTVKMHLARMCRRYGVDGRVQLVLLFRSLSSQVEAGIA
jgi:DNA-binding NarL/FixJ family response regulator